MYILEKLLLPIVFLGVHTPPLVVFTMLPFNQDPAHFFLLNFQWYSNGGLTAKIMSLIPRLGLLLVYFEALRVWMLTIVMLIMCITHMKSCVAIMQEGKLSVETVILRYNHQYLIYSVTAFLMEKAATFSITTLFFMLVAEALACLKGAQLDINMPMRFSLLGSVVFTFTVYFVVLDQISSFTEGSEQVIRDCRYKCSWGIVKQTVLVAESIGKY